MEILHKNSDIPQNVALILGFFDGVHAGHREVLKNTPKVKKLIVTFSTSPAEYFGKNFKYIYNRDYNYKLLEDIGIDYVYEQNFENIANITAKSYLDFLKTTFSPISITTGFNHTFGANRQGTADFLSKNADSFEYFCTPQTEINGEIVSSTKIKEFLNNGEIELANRFLTQSFTIHSTVIKGAEIGKKLGFPTANMKYPKEIIKIPYGVYKVKTLDKIAIMNWGIKPTFGSKEEVLEIHIPDFEENLYSMDLSVEILAKIRDEKKFENIEELKKQIERDMACLKL